MMKMNTPLVSVVIPTFNRRRSLDKVISPLLADPATGEIVVVVDGASDDTFAFLTEWSRSESRIRVIFQKNAGAASARHTGVLESRFELVLLIDDDVEAGPGLVTGHAGRHAESDHLVVLGYMPIILPSKRTAGQAATVLYAGEYEKTCTLYEKDRSEIFRHLWAGNMSMRRADALRLGDKTEIRLDFHEDLRFGLRCERAGLTPVFDRSLSSRHLHERSVRRFAVDAGRSGMARAEIISEYPELAPTLDPFLDISSRGKLAERFLSLPWVGPIASPIAMTLCTWSGQLRAWRLEIALARGIRRIETARSFRKVSKSIVQRSVVAQSEFI
jgi:glycosyltransferase involved in cell wall biosynthesis